MRGRFYGAFGKLVSRGEGEIGSQSREEGDLPSLPILPND